MGIQGQRVASWVSGVVEAYLRFRAQYNMSILNLLLGCDASNLEEMNPCLKLGPMLCAANVW